MNAENKSVEAVCFAALDGGEKAEPSVSPDSRLSIKLHWGEVLWVIEGLDLSSSLFNDQRRRSLMDKIKQQARVGRRAR